MKCDRSHINVIIGSEQWQNLYVSASAGVAFNFIGFEESVTIS